MEENFKIKKLIISKNRFIIEVMRVLNSLSDLNILRILHLIWQSKKISRVEIASILKLDKSTVTKIIAELTEKNLVHETDLGTSRPQGGRKPVFLEINGEYACTGGIQINPQKIYVCLEDLRGTILYEFMQEVDAASYAQNGFLGLLQNAISLLKENAERLHISLAGIGLGLPGMVDTNCGTIIQSIPLMIENAINVSEKIKEFTDIPLFVENDARCCCYTERIGLDNDASKNLMYVFIEHRQLQPLENSPKNISVGLGLVLNGKIYHGSNSSAGEFRSMLWKEPSSSQFSLGTESIQSLEDDSAKIIFSELSRHIAFLANLLALDFIFVGGLEKKHAENLVALINEEAQRLWPYNWNKNTSINIATISERAVAYGAGTMVLDKLFSVPDLASHKGVPEKSNYQSLLELAK